MTGIALRPRGDRLILNRRTLTGLCGQLNGMFAKAVFVGHPTLLVVNALARIEIKNRLGNAARIRLIGGPSQSLRVLRILSKGAGDQGQLAILAGTEGQLGHGLVALGRTMIAITFGGKTRGINHVADTANFTLGAEIGFPSAVTAGRKIAFNRRRPLAVRCEHLNHAPSLISVDGSHRPAQYLNAFGAIEIKGRSLALTIWHRRWNNIGNKANPTHTKRRACTKTARRNLEILRIVLTILNVDTRNSSECLRRIDPSLICTDPVSIDNINSCR